MKRTPEAAEPISLQIRNAFDQLAPAVRNALIQSARPPKPKQRESFASRSRAVFDSLDQDKDGYLTMLEFGTGCRTLGVPISREGVATLFRRGAKVDYADFVSFCETRTAEIRRVFDYMDTDRSGTLTSEEMKRSIHALGMKISSEQLRDLMLHLDADKHEAVCFDEFNRALLLLPVVNPEAVFESWQAMAIDDAQSEYTLPRDAEPTAAQPTAHAAVLHSLCAGGAAGAVSRTVTAPIDRIKTLAQAAPPGAPAAGVAAGARAILAEGGVRAFFRGNGANVVKVIPETAVKLCAFDACKRLLARDPGNVTMPERFLAGGVAGAAAQTLIYPLEILKTRMAVSPPGTYAGMSDCLSKLVRYEGAAALYKGLVPSLLGIFPYAGVDLMVNSVLKDLASAHYMARGREPGVPALLAGGMVSSSAAMLVTYPLNLIRTRLQASGMPGAPVYYGAVDCFRRAVAADGVAGLYKGIGPNLLKVLPATSISYTIFDLLNRRNWP